MDPTKQYALLVGLSKYPAIGDLKGPVNDLADMTRWLTEDLHVPLQNIKSFSDVPTRYVEPRVADFEDWITELEDKAKDAPFPFGQRLYVYFAGHGYNATTAQQALILPRSRATGIWSAVPMVPLRNGLQLRAYFQEIVLLFDSCRSILKYAPEAPWADRPAAHPKHASVRSYSIFASKSGSPAKEVEFTKDRWAGVVTQAFLAGVQGYAADAEGVVYAHKLKSFLYAAVKDRLGRDTEPDVEDPSTEEEPWPLFYAQQKLPRIVIRPTTTKTGTVTITVRKDRTTHQVDLAAGVQVKEVERGYYLVRLPDGQEKEVMAVWEEKVVEV
jgi:hypothetical protein